MRTLNDLFVDLLKDVYYAERKITKTLPTMIDKASSLDLRAALSGHLDETHNQVKRLEQVFEMIDQKPRGKTCQAIEGIIAEGDDVMKEAKSEAVCDAGMVGAAQAVEHYEIARYGTLIKLASQLGLKDAVKLLEATLAEEVKADATLGKLTPKVYALAA